MVADWLFDAGSGRTVVIRDVNQTRRQLEAQEDIYRSELALLRELVMTVRGTTTVAAYLHFPLLGIVKGIT